MNARDEEIAFAEVEETIEEEWAKFFEEYLGDRAGQLEVVDQEEEIDG